MKDRTRYYLARLAIMIEKDISDLDQTLNSGGVSKHEAIGIQQEQQELKVNLAEIKKCDFWLQDVTA